MTRPQPASACSIEQLGDFLTGGIFSTAFPTCKAPGPGPVVPGVGPCNLSGASASGSTPDLHKYSYVLGTCGWSPTHMRGEYNVGQQTAHEELNGGVFDWVCPGGDPWSQAGSAYTTSDFFHWSAGAPAPCIVYGTVQGVPLSTLNIGAEAHDTLNAALNDALTEFAIQAIKQAAAKEAAKEAARQAAIQAELTVTSITDPYHSGRSALIPGPAVTSITDPYSSALSGLISAPAPAPQPIAYHDPSIGADGWPKLDLRTQGEAVKSLQYLLQGQGQALAASGVDGKFGPETDAAVRAFQKLQGLTADGAGVVGQQTWTALIVTVDYSVPDSKKVAAAVQAVQSQLKLRGLLAPAFPVDGIFGPSEGPTYTAVRAYQQDPARNLTVDGQVGPKTWQSLLAGN